MRRVIFTAVLTGSLLVVPGPLGVRHHEAEAADPGAGAGADVAKKPKPRDPITEFRGLVKAVDAGSITVQGFAVRPQGTELCVWENDAGTERTYTGRRITVDLPDRQYVCTRIHLGRKAWVMTLVSGEEVTVRRSDQPPLRFRADKDLASGGVPPAEGEVWSYPSYRLADVRAGDEVWIRCRTENGEDLCHAVRIDRRPGGVVPPAPWEPPDARDPHHRRANAYQQYEENGTPLPDEYSLRVQYQKNAEMIAKAKQDAQRLLDEANKKKPKRPEKK